MKILPPCRGNSSNDSAGDSEGAEKSSCYTRESESSYQGSLLTNTDSPWLHSGKSSFPWKRLKESYGIDFDETKLLMPTVQTQTSRKCIIMDEGGRKWFLKEIPIVVSNEQACLSCKFQDYLSHRTELVVVPLKCLDGSYIFFGSGTRIVVTPFVSGVSYKGRINQSISSAEGLARLHTASIGFFNESTASDPVEELLRFLTNIELNESERATAESLMTYVSAELENLELIECGEWIHGDPSPFNLIFSPGDSVEAFTDFDNVARTNYMHDVAELIITHCAVSYQGSTSSFRDRIYRFFEKEKAESMLQRYKSASDSSILLDSQKLCNGLRRVWLELMLLGVIRGDFTFRMALDCIDFGNQICLDVERFACFD